MSWATKPTIKLPGGAEYAVQSDDLKAEIFKAMGVAGMSEVRVFIDGVEIPDPDNLPTNSVAALAQQVRLEGVEPVRLKSYDKAAR